MNVPLNIIERRSSPSGSERRIICRSQKELPQTKWRLLQGAPPESPQSQRTPVYRRVTV